MKKMVIIVLIVAAVLAMCFWENIEQAFHPGQSKIGGAWVSDENVAKYDFGSIQADYNGDTYCKKCDKYIEGKVRICTFCGKYI